MRIAVLNGSPKGLTSVTMQYVLFLRKRFPQHEFTILNVAHDLRRLEADEAAFGEVVGTIRAADGVLWAFPLYVLLVHAYYKRFIELIWERGVPAAFQSKYAAVLTTSIRFFDHTAHNYMSAICDDLDMKCVASYSADMYDLLKGRGAQSPGPLRRGVLPGDRARRACPKTPRPAPPRHVRLFPRQRDPEALRGGQEGDRARR